MTGAGGAEYGLLMAVTTLKAVTEMALMLLLAQGVVGLLSRLAGAVDPLANPVYRLIAWCTRPLRAGVRRLTPSIVLDRHLGLLAGLLLAWCWVLLVVSKLHLAGVAS